MAKGIIDFLLLPPTGVVFIIGVLMLVVAGAMFIFGPLISPDNPKLVSQAQSVMTSVVIGLIIVFAAWMLVNAFFALIGVAETDFGRGIKEWYKIQCPIELPEGYVPPGLALLLSSPQGDSFSVSKGESFETGLKIDPPQPISGVDIILDFDFNLLELVDIVPNPDSNLKTFVPLTSEGYFDKQKVIETANKEGVINFGATCFSLADAALTEPQSSPFDLATLVFKARDVSGTAKIEFQFDGEGILNDSNLIATIGEQVIDVLGKPETKIEVTIL